MGRLGISPDYHQSVRKLNKLPDALLCRFWTNFPDSWYAVRAPPRKSEPNYIQIFGGIIMAKANFCEKPATIFLMCS